MIRAYKVEGRFIQESINKVDFNQSCCYTHRISNRWLSIRLEFLTDIILFFAGLFAVHGRGTISVGLVGLTVSSALRVSNFLKLSRKNAKNPL